MRVVLLNTGTELLLGDVRDAHLSFIARDILPLGLRVAEQRTVPDGVAIRDALSDLIPRADIVFVTGGLGPTTDDITRDITAELLGLELIRNDEVMGAITRRLSERRIKITDSISRQADVPRGAQVLPNDNGTAPGLFLRSGASASHPSPHLFLLPGPPRELQPMFRSSVLPLLRSLVKAPAIERRLYKIANTGESVVEEAVGKKILAIPGVELGYCARPGEVDLRIVGEPDAVEHAHSIIMQTLGPSIFSSSDEILEEVIVKSLARRHETVSVAESCTGGWLANRLTNVPGASDVFLAGYITYANEAKIDLLSVASTLLAQQGAVSGEVARAMAEGARDRAKSTYALATTGIAGPSGGSVDKPVGTVFVALALAGAETIARRLFFPTDRETFKQMVAQAAFDLLRKKLV
jgi:nicotinamide-nucleotide amidase